MPIPPARRRGRGSRTRPLVALLTVLALGLAACGGGDDLSEDPQEAVVEAFENRTDGGFTATVSVSLSDDARQQIVEDDPEAERFLDIVDGDVLTIAAEGDQFGLAVHIGDDRPIQFRVLDDAVYFLVDVPTLVERFAGDSVDLEEIRGQVGQMSMFLGEAATLVEAALDGDWAGVTDIPDDAGEQLQDVFGDLQPGATPPPDEEASEIAEELGFTDPSVFAERYLVVESGGEGTYEASLRARDLARAVQDAGGELSGGMAAGDADVSEVPETIGGVIIEVDGDEVSAVEIDLARVAASVESEGDLDDLAEGDAVVRIEFGADTGELLATPDDAQTITFTTLMDLLEQFAGFAQSFGGGFGGTDSATESETVPAVPEEFSTELPSDFPTDFPTEFETQ